MTLRPFHALLAALAIFASTSAESCETHLVDDNGFDLWCGESLCHWELERGSIGPTPTWHTADPGVELVGSDVAISQLSTANIGCIRFDVVADVEESARVVLELDFYDDGVIDYERVLPTSRWEPIRYLVTAPLFYQGVRVRLRKEGPGQARLAQLEAVADSECFDKPVEIAARPLGATCNAAATCASDHCALRNTGSYEALTCGLCRDDADCEGGAICGLAAAEREFLEPYRQCEVAGAGAMGDECLRNDECSSGTCGPYALDGFCEADGSACERDDQCPIAPNADTGRCLSFRALSGRCR